MMWTRRRRGRRGWPVALVLLQVLVALAVARHRGVGVDGPQLALLAAGPVALRLLFGRPAWAAVAVATIDLGYGLAGYPIWAVLPSTVAAVVGPIARARHEAFRQWQEEERRRRAAERERQAEQVRRQAADERVRIARELHDILAHSLSLINVRASVALEVMDSSPHEIRPALEAIKQASRDGLTEVRAVLAGMHEDEERPPVPRQPLPTLARLEDLAEQAQAAGLRVAVVCVGTQRELSAAVELAAYRVIQEAVTNVMRHSAARSATVTLTYAEDRLGIDISDPGPAQERPALAHTGSGLVGIGERAAALGGTATSGPDRTGGFVVRVELPLTGAEAAA
jgi:signal transduction histidine kinase